MRALVAVASCLLTVILFVGAGLLLVVMLALRTSPISGYDYALYGMEAILCGGVGLLIALPLGLFIAYSVNGLFHSKWN